VMVSQTAGYGPAKAGSVLDFGSRIVVGAKGAASVEVGDCRLSVPANSSLDISRVENNICLKLVGTEQTAAVPSGSGGGISGAGARGAVFGVPEGIFAGTALGAALLTATQDDDNGVSR
jgi:hypothetical protein